MLRRSIKIGVRSDFSLKKRQQQTTKIKERKEKGTKGMEDQN